MPAARGQCAEQRCFRGFAVEVKRLGIELRCERLDLRRIDRMVAARKTLAHTEIVEEKRVCSRFDRLAHQCLQSDLHHDSYWPILCQCSARASPGWPVRSPAVSSVWASGGAFSFCVMP